ncbi:MAG: GNAT family N-acetyltransferase [Bdellovibrionales bacterium]|nr:GNAT family N-acetyltransferase [Bdellovibrionales bacterium]
MQEEFQDGDKLMAVKVRAATPDDAAEIANVHINSWREAYKGLLPQVFLDERPLYFKNRYQLWKSVLSVPNNITFVAECSENGVIGMVNGSKARNAEYEDYAEVYCLYLLQKYHGQKIGFELLKKSFEAFEYRGYSKAYLWVLEGNPTIKFYEKTGGIHKGHIMEETVAGQLMNELCFTWDSLDLDKV